jgi:hypothetical protein
VFQVKVDRARGVAELVLEGAIREEEMRRFLERAREEVRLLMKEGLEMRTYVDVRHFRPASPEAAAILREVQEVGLKGGVKRVAEVVHSELVALQLNRIANESGIARILRRFHDPDEAWHWLLEEDEQRAVG